MKSTQLTPNKVQGQSPATTTGDRALIVFLAACTTFVIGYTTVRVSLAQNQGFDTPASGANVQQTVIPHEATLWGGFGE